MPYKHCLIVIFIFIIAFVRAQSPDHAQTFTNLVFTNPAFAGTRVCPRIYANYRNKYTNLGSAYVTYLATYDQHWSLVNGDVGVVAFRDVQANGVFTSSYFNLMYARGVQLNNTLRLKFGIEAGYIASQMTNSGMSYADMIDPAYGYIYSTEEQSINISQRGLDLTAGVLLLSPKYYFGFSSYHLNRSRRIEPDKGSLAARSYSLHGGLQFSTGGGFSGQSSPLLLAPNFNFQFQQHFSQLLLGLYVQRHKLLTGLWIKHSLKNFESFVLLVGYVQKRLKFAYNCDMYFWTGKLSLPQTHEVSVTYYFSCSEHKKKPRAMNCPGL